MSVKASGRILSWYGITFAPTCDAAFEVRGQSLWVAKSHSAHACRCHIFLSFLLLPPLPSLLIIIIHRLLVLLQNNYYLYYP